MMNLTIGEETPIKTDPSDVTGPTSPGTSCLVVLCCNVGRGQASLSKYLSR